MNRPTPYVARLMVYPIKSLDGILVEKATVLSGGALQGDREFAIVDTAGRFVNGKREPRVHGLRSHFDLGAKTVTLSVRGAASSETFHLAADRPALEAWLSDYFGFTVKLRQNQETGFPDDTDSPGPTVISTATLETIAAWYLDLDAAAMRRRFRSNIEIAGAPAFWEDCLFGASGQSLDFSIGTVQFKGVNPCQRCVVVTRDPDTGDAYPAFQKTFAVQRQQSLPAWADSSRFNHFFRLAVNTKLPASETGKTIAIGDAVGRT